MFLVVLIFWELGCIPYCLSIVLWDRIWRRLAGHGDELGCMNEWVYRGYGLFWFQVTFDLR